MNNEICNLNGVTIIPWVAMSESEEENFCFYGKPLDLYDEDAFPKKKPITVEEQIATDSQGRRRFHGAFTGGFSAGFFNTVGSLEGWLPGDFKSSRGEKQKHVIQNPEDFMDDEDMGEFGFAPQSIRATKDYSTSNKRKRKVFTDGPIPGEPVLHTLLTAGNETVGHLLLRNIGMKEKIKTKEEMTSSNSRTYGCEMPITSSLSETLEIEDYELPDFYNTFLMNPKKDTFSLGYVGLDKSHVNLFRSSDLILQEKNKKLSIRGQAFGVGAFENDDDDIYAKEDMSNYDFEMTKEQEKPKNKLSNSAESVLDIFIKAKINLFSREKYPPPVIPKSFTGKHKVKKSRFEPIKSPEAPMIDRRNIDATQRAELLGEEKNEKFTASKLIPSAASTSDYVTDKYVKKENCDTNESLEASNSQTSKQNSNFDPSSLWNDRFVSGAQDDEATNILAPVKKYENDHYSKEMKDAAEMKMYGPLTRISEDWQPCALLCKRFNVPEPFSDKPRSSQNRIKMKNLIFEYQKHHEENVPLKAGLAQVTTANKEVTVIDDNYIEKKSSDENQITHSLFEARQGTNDIETSDREIVEVKEEVVEEVENNKEISQVKAEEVNEVLDITDRLNIEEKEDLFRAVFMSSSESEDEQNDEHSETLEEKDHSNEVREMELKSNILGEDIQIPKIKPIKEGILSSLNFKILPTSTKPVIETVNESIMNADDALTTNHSNEYGPKLPEKMQIGNFSNNALVFSKKYSDSSSDEWVEKNEIEKSKNKKHKKEKSSHRKKHKHKKKKKH